MDPGPHWPLPCPGPVKTRLVSTCGAVAHAHGLFSVRAVARIRGLSPPGRSPPRLSQGCGHKLPQAGWLKTAEMFAHRLEATSMKRRCQPPSGGSARNPSLPLPASGCGQPHHSNLCLCATSVSFFRACFRTPSAFPTRTPVLNSPK